MTSSLTMTTEIGKARARKEDARLVTGQTTWTDNMVLPGLLHLAFARSPFAHATIKRVDTSAARAMPGVVAVFSGQDFKDEQGSLPCAWPVTADIVIPAHPAMAVDEVRYVGEAVAVVVARDRYACRLRHLQLRRLYSAAERAVGEERVMIAGRSIALPTIAHRGVDMAAVNITSKSCVQLGAIREPTRSLKGWSAEGRTPNTEDIKCHV